MTKVAIKNENITSFGGIFHIMDVFSKLGFEKLTESVLGKRGSSGKAFSHGSIFGSLFFSYLCGGECLEDINVLIGQFKQRPDPTLTLTIADSCYHRGSWTSNRNAVSYKSDLHLFQYTRCLIISNLGNWLLSKHPENFRKIILPIKVGLK